MYICHVPSSLPLRSSSVSRAHVRTQHVSQPLNRSQKKKGTYQQSKNKTKKRGGGDTKGGHEERDTRQLTLLIHLLLKLNLVPRLLILQPDNIPRLIGQVEARASARAAAALAARDGRASRAGEGRSARGRRRAPARRRRAAI